MIAAVTYKLKIYTYQRNICTLKLRLVFVLFISLQILSHTHKYVCYVSGLVVVSYWRFVPSVPMCTPCSNSQVDVDPVPDRKKHENVLDKQLCKSYGPLLHIAHRCMNIYYITDCTHTKNELHYRYYGIGQPFAASHSRQPCAVRTSHLLLPLNRRHHHPIQLIPQPPILHHPDQAAKAICCCRTDHRQS